MHMQQVNGESTLLDTLPYVVSTNNWIDKMIIHAVKIAVVMWRSYDSSKGTHTKK